MGIRRSLRRDENTSTYDLILEIAERLIVEKGPDNWRLQDIAQELGIQVPSLYGHFKGRNGIIQAIEERHTQDELEFPYHMEAGETPKEGLLRGTNACIDYFIAHPARLILVVMDYATPGGLDSFKEIDNAGYADDMLHNTRLWPMYERVEKLLDQGFEEGIFRKIDVVHFINAMFGALTMNLMFPTNLAHLPQITEQEIEVVRGRVLDVVERVVFV